MNPTETKRQWYEQSLLTGDLEIRVGDAVVLTRGGTLIARGSPSLSVNEEGAERSMHVRITSDATEEDVRAVLRYFFGIGSLEPASEFPPARIARMIRVVDGLRGRSCVIDALTNDVIGLLEDAETYRAPTRCACHDCRRQQAPEAGRNECDLQRAERLAAFHRHAYLCFALIAAADAPLRSLEWATLSVALFDATRGVEPDRSHGGDSGGAFVAGGDYDDDTDDFGGDDGEGDTPSGGHDSD